MTPDDPKDHDEPKRSYQNLGELSGQQKIAAILHNLEAYPFYVPVYDEETSKYVPRQVGYEEFCNQLKADYFGLDKKNQKTLRRRSIDTGMFNAFGVREASKKFINMLTLIEVMKKPDGSCGKRTIAAGLEALEAVKLFIRRQERAELAKREKLESMRTEVPDSKLLSLNRDIEDTHIDKQKHELAADGLDEIEKAIYQCSQEMGAKVRKQITRDDPGFDVGWGRWE